MRPCVLFALCILGCAHAPPAVPPPPPEPGCPACPECPECPACPSAAPPAPDVTVAPTAPAMVSTVTADLDGDGVAEEVRLFNDGALRVFHGAIEVTDAAGRPAGQVDDYAPATALQDGNDPGRIAAIDLDRADRQREIVFSESDGDEDPPVRYQLFVLRERRLWSMTRSPDRSDTGIWGQHGAVPRIPGDGTFTLVSTRCVRDADPEAHARGISERTTQRFRLADGVFRRAELIEDRVTTRSPSDCVQAACPVVLAGPAHARVGEILRDLRGEAAETWQPLRLSPEHVGADGVLELTVREEKHETTWIDGVRLVADGTTILPEACALAPDALCDADASRLTLSPGQSVSLRFRVGRASNLTLWARGYYNPLPHD